MKRNKQQIEDRTKEIYNYLLSNDMADISVSEFWKLTNELHVLETLSANSGIKSYQAGSNYMNSYKLMK